jgi:hypothetical protein
MKRVSVLIVILGLVIQMGCQLPVKPSAMQTPVLTEKEVIEIANQEVKRRGFDPLYKVQHVSKLSTKIHVYIFLTHESCNIVADENGGAITIEAKNPGKFSFFKRAGSKSFESEKEVESYFAEQCKRFLPDDPVRELYCVYIPKGWMLFYSKEWFLESGDHFAVIIREDGTFHEIWPGK